MTGRQRLPGFDRIAAAQQDEEERWSECDQGSKKRTNNAARCVTNHRNGLDEWAWGDLAKCDGIQELSPGHPVVCVYSIVLHERDNDETAACGCREPHPSSSGDEPVLVDKSAKDVGSPHACGVGIGDRAVASVTSEGHR